ncbi:uncharacterized protein [Ptychodera flava]|uniref:uncharacterized protein n=1 Tax=Ptychodera flava TaxID=63121 RepID=UPI003969C44B
MIFQNYDLPFVMIMTVLACKADHVVSDRDLDVNTAWHGRSEESNSFNSGCARYRIITRPKPWLEAKQYCENEGGILAEIKSPGEQEFLLSVLEILGLDKDLWIGISDIDDEGSWRYASKNFPICYYNWTNDPSTRYGRHHEDCATLRHNSNFQWFPVRCSRRSKFLCEFNITNPDSDCSHWANDYVTCNDGRWCIPRDNICDGVTHCLDRSDELNCGNTTTQYPMPKANAIYGPYVTSCSTFKVFTKHEKWFRAKRSCRRDGGVLVQITDGETQDIINNMLGVNHLDVYDYWIDGRDKVIEGTWMFDDNRRLCYSNWLDNDVGDSERKDCAAIGHQSDYRWQDRECSKKHPFICQYKLDGVPDKCFESPYFVCNSGECFPKEIQCDGFRNCFDGSDEIDCFCCLEKCMDMKATCDGVYDCHDITDEAVCHPELTMSDCSGTDEFQCQVNTCVSTSLVCDARVDCRNGADEGFTGSVKCPSTDPPERFVTGIFTREEIIATGQSHQVGAFNMEGSVYLAIPNYQTNRVHLYKFMTDSLQLYQSIEVTSVYDVEYFNKDSEHYLVFAVNIQDKNSFIYRWDGQYFTFFQTLQGSTYHYLDALSFQVITHSGSTRHFVALSARPLVGFSKVELFEWQNDQFQKVQELLLDQVTYGSSFNVGNVTYLVFAEAGDTGDSPTKVYMFNETSTSLEIHQTLPIYGASSAIVSFWSPDGALYLFDSIFRWPNSNHQTKSVLYVWRDNQFAVHQIIPTYAPSMACPFVINDELFLLITSGKGSSIRFRQSILFKLHQAAFHTYQTFITRGPSDCATFNVHGSQYILIPDPMRLGALYKWNP